jgi:hypothetical protein
MLSAFRPRLWDALSGLALAGFLVAWLTLWPFWVVLNRAFERRVTVR